MISKRHSTVIVVCECPSPPSEGLTSLSSLNMSGCSHITDASLPLLGYVRGSLLQLNISHCLGITEKGLPHLCVLR